MRWKWIFVIPLALVGFTLFIAAGGFIVQQLWNWLLPPLFGWHVVTCWQALGLLVLCRILFGSLGMHRGPGSRMRGPWAGRSPEDRERFRQRMRERFGMGGTGGEHKEC